MRALRTAAPSAEEIILAHQRHVWRFLVALGCGAADADDLTQETFVQLLRGKFEYQGPAQTAAFLYRVAKNLFISTIRRRRLAVMVSNLDDADTQWQAFDGEHPFDSRVEYLRHCLQSLDERARKAVDMRYRLESPRAQIAVELGLAESGLKALLERVRERLKECVERKLAHEQ